MRFIYLLKEFSNHDTEFIYSLFKNAIKSITKKEKYHKLQLILAKKDIEIDKRKFSII